MTTSFLSMSSVAGGGGGVRRGKYNVIEILFKKKGITFCQEKLVDCRKQKPYTIRIYAVVCDAVSRIFMQVCSEKLLHFRLSLASYSPASVFLESLAIVCLHSRTRERKWCRV